MLEDGFVVRSVGGHAVGPGLAHAHSVAEALGAEDDLGIRDLHGEHGAVQAEDLLGGAARDDVLVELDLFHPPAGIEGKDLHLILQFVRVHIGGRPCPVDPLGRFLSSVHLLSGLPAADLMGAFHRTQILKFIAVYVLAVFGPSAGCGVIHGVDDLALVEHDLPRRVHDRLGDDGVFIGILITPGSAQLGVGTIGLTAAAGGADVRVWICVAAPMADRIEGVGPGGHRLGLQRFQRIGDRHLSGHHAQDILFQQHILYLPLFREENLHIGAVDLGEVDVHRQRRPSGRGDDGLRRLLHGQRVPLRQGAGSNGAYDEQHHRHQQECEPRQHGPVDGVYLLFFARTLFLCAHAIIICIYFCRIKRKMTNKR